MVPMVERGEAGRVQKRTHLTETRHAPSRRGSPATTSTRSRTTPSAPGGAPAGTGTGRVMVARCRVVGAVVEAAEHTRPSIEDGGSREAGRAATTSSPARCAGARRIGRHRRTRPPARWATRRHPAAAAESARPAVPAAKRVRRPRAGVCPESSDRHAVGARVRKGGDSGNARPAGRSLRPAQPPGAPCALT